MRKHVENQLCYRIKTLIFVSFIITQHNSQMLLKGDLYMFPVSVSVEMFSSLFCLYFLRVYVFSNSLYFEYSEIYYFKYGVTNFYVLNATLFISNNHNSMGCRWYGPYDMYPFLSEQQIAVFLQRHYNEDSGLYTKSHLQLACPISSFSLSIKSVINMS